VDGLAKEVYDLIKNLDGESAKVVAGMIVNEGVHYNLGDFDVAKAYMEQCGAELDEMKSSVVRSFVSKRLAGEDVTSLVAAVEAIAKAEGFDERKHKRNADGTFGNKPGRAFHGKIKDKAGVEHEVRHTTVNTMDAIARAGKQSFRGRPNDGAPGNSRAFVPGIGYAENIGQGAEFLNATVGGYTPAAAQIGLSAASYVGSHAERAQAAFGPAVDRAKYRYKGTERKLDDKLKAAITNDRKKYGEAFGSRVVTGTDEVPGVRRVQATGSTGGSIRGERQQYVPSQTLQYFQDHLPNEKFAALQRFAGHQPPSEGVIIDRQGKVGGQMVGYGDDWYLPFNLGNLGALKGGQYIRTRTHGGLSTEDVYTGLMAGAASMTVVSHNGTYTMDFDPSLRGSRRYSQTARQMTLRYGQLLDAVKKGEIRVNQVRDIDPAREYEMMDLADGDPNVLAQLRTNNLARPIPSRAKQREWGQDFLTGMAEDYSTRSGDDMNPHEFIETRVIPAMVKESQKRSVIMGEYGTSVMDPMMDDETAEHAARAALEADPRQAVTAIGGDGAGARYDEAMRQHMYEYRDALRPVTLDGQGYAYAAAALKEQFPYFIKGTRWIGPKGQQTRGASDKGYVKPRYNRSEDIHEGYFDDSIHGFGKVPASRTRYQNHKIRSTVETGWRPGGASGEGQTYARPGSSGGSSTPASPQTPGGGGGGQPSPQNSPQAVAPGKAEKARDADLNLAQHLLSQKTFGARMVNIPTLADKTKMFASVKGQDAQLHKDAGWMENSTLKDFARPYSDFEEMSDEDLHKTVASMIEEADRIHAFDDIDRELVAQHHARGGPLKIADINLGEYDADSDDDIDFGDSSLEAGHGKVSYSLKWNTAPGMKDWRKANDIGSIADGDIDDQISEAIAVAQEELHSARQGDNDDMAREARRDIITGLKAKQLARHWRNAPGDSSGNGGGGINPIQIAPTQILGGGGLSGSARPAQTVSQHSYAVSGSLRPIGS
jgi:hypothetical protein